MDRFLFIFLLALFAFVDVPDSVRSENDQSLKVSRKQDRAVVGGTTPADLIDGIQRSVTAAGLAVSAEINSALTTLCGASTACKGVLSHHRLNRWDTT